MSDTALTELANRIEVIDRPAGTVIVQQDTPADAFYFVRQGEVEVTRETAPGKTARIAVVGSGRGFGEVALLTFSHRSASVTAKAAVTLYRLAKRDFDDIIIMDAAFMGTLVKQASTDARYNRIKNLKPFALLETEKMPALTEKLIENRYPAGAHIINQGEAGDFYYIVKSGRVAVLVRDDSRAVPRQAAVLEEGDGFGEEALIRDHRRNATVQALEDVTVLALDKVDFDRILKSSYLDYVYAEDFDELDPSALAGYVFLDARIPPEYEEAHIESALNIPL